MTPLYIDPGTGSMLFTIVIGLVTTLWFVLRGCASRLGTLLAGGRRQRRDREGLIIWNESPRYDRVFAALLEELDRRGERAVYLVCDSADPALARAEKGQYRHIQVELAGNGNRLWARLNTLEADVVLMTTPGLEVYQLKRSRSVGFYAHLLHAVDDATSYRLFGLDWFDAVLLSGEYQAGALRALEAKRRLKARELPVVGSTYLDSYATAIENLRTKTPDSPDSPANPAATITVLVSPSWGASGILARYGSALIDPLLEAGFTVILRPHPQSFESEKELIDRLATRYQKEDKLEWDRERDNTASLSRANVMISDFSGIIFDYAFLFGGPILYALSDFDMRPYDAGCLEERPWKFQAIEALGNPLDPTRFDELPDIITSALADPARADAVTRLRNEAWQYRGEAACRAADYLIQTRERIQREGKPRA